MNPSLLCAALLLPLALHAEPIQITNPEINETDANGNPAGWWKAGGAIAQHAKGEQGATDEAGDPKRGRVLHIRFNEGEGRLEWFQAPVLGQDIQLVPGKRYRFTVWFRAEMKSKPAKLRDGGYIKLRCVDADWGLLQTIFLTADGNFQGTKHEPPFQLKKKSVPWTKLQCVFEVPQDTHRLGITLAASNQPGDYWADGFTIEEAGSARPGPFEK